MLTFACERPASPYAVAFSGGGDSTALLHAVRGDNPTVFIVDHALRAGSNIDSAQAANVARQWGLDTHVLRWEHGPIKTGLQEKARMARYELIGQACRERSIKALITGHTQDDQAETLWMRYERGTGWRGAAGMQVRTYAPVWPALAGIDILRPLLTTSRQALRAYNRTHGLSWIEDPANTNPHFSRIRAREALKRQPRAAQTLLTAAHDMQQGLRLENVRLRDSLEAVSWSKLGVAFTQNALPIRAFRLLIMAVGGQADVPDWASTVRVRSQIEKCGSATLSGTHIIKTRSGYWYGRERSAVTGRRDGRKPAVKSKYLITNRPQIWDGRLWTERLHTANKSTPTILLSHVHACKGQLDTALVKALKDIAEPLRAAVPVLLVDEVGMLCEPRAELTIRWLAKERLERILRAV